MSYRSEKRLYLTADRERVVEEGDENAAYLLVAEGGELSDEEVNRYKLKGGNAPEQSQLDREQEALKLAEERGSEDEAAVRRQTIAGLEDEEKAQKTQRKQVDSPPENKARSMREEKDKD
jgi:hypothetical protein